jgi:glucokinase
MELKNDKRIVMTLDAGGTNFVFSAIQANEEIIEPVRFPSNADNLDLCLKTIVDGFQEVKNKLKEEPSAISFAFPGPADYPAGIIGDLANLPAFRGGIALGPMLQEKFNIPVYLNNDGDLFTYGEAIAGMLPEINEKLKEAGSSKQYKNLFGITLGTGFGGGIVRNDELFIGDNSAAGEIWAMRNKLYPNIFAEESVSIRAVKREYCEYAKLKFTDLSPKDIFNIANGDKEGNREAALMSFNRLGEAVGDALANAITLVDGLVVIGGGLTGASSLFLPGIINEMNSEIESIAGDRVDRMEIKAFNLEDEDNFSTFLKGDQKEILIPGTDKKIMYDHMKRIGVGLSRLGTSKAVSIGAYAFALKMLDNI